MKLRSNQKIEALIRGAFPNAGCFRDPSYDDVLRSYSKALDDWERYRDSICPANLCPPRCCVCATDPRLKDHPLRLNCQKLVNEVNRLDREAYDKLSAAQNNLRSMYRRINELKRKFQNGSAPAFMNFKCDDSKIKSHFKQHIVPLIYGE